MIRPAIGPHPFCIWCDHYVKPERRAPNTPSGETQCQDCHDDIRLREAVAVWAKAYTQRSVDDPGRIPANFALAKLARELGLVDA